MRLLRPDTERDVVRDVYAVALVTDDEQPPAPAPRQRDEHRWLMAPVLWWLLFGRTQSRRR